MGIPGAHSSSTEGTVFSFWDLNSREGVLGARSPGLVTWSRGSWKVPPRVRGQVREWGEPRTLPGRCLPVRVSGHRMPCCSLTSTVWGGGGALVVWKQASEELASW